MVRLKFLADRFFVGLFCVIMASLSGCDFLLPKETVYVTVPILNLREKPTTKSQVVERLQRGRELEIFERANPWLHVRVDGKTKDGYTAIMSETPQPCAQHFKKTSRVVLQTREKSAPHPQRALRSLQPKLKPRKKPK